MGMCSLCASERSSGRLFLRARRAHHRPALSDVREALSHVLWIGGGPQAGKTTLSRLLAGKWDLKIYNLDWHGVRDHERRPHPMITAFAAMSMDERWAKPSIDELVERAIAFWE